MRFVVMKLHTREEAKEGEKDAKQPEEKPVAKWEPTVEGYLRFLVDSKLVYDTLELIVDRPRSLIMPTLEIPAWRGQANCQKIWSGSKSKVTPSPGLQKPVSPMPATFKCYLIRTLKLLYVTFTMSTLPIVQKMPVEHMASKGKTHTTDIPLHE
ncbi:hypothetical protein SAY86_030111 [Trapa natans]|uniref:heme oxygenase (biliverdin-producing) n=1 Tax=Trapa natans TaxID=22666 RepID=A0AAN7MKF1_TRANT|nr:hypothetical protein SAY86_030111 [Trapa natans]